MSVLPLTVMGQMGELWYSSADKWYLEKYDLKHAHGLHPPIADWCKERLSAVPTVVKLSMHDYELWFATEGDLIIFTLKWLTDACEIPD